MPNSLMVPKKRILLLPDLDRTTTILRDQDAIASRDRDGNTFPVLVEPAGADGEHLGLVQLLDARLRQEDAACCFRLGLHALHEDAVE